MHIHFALGSIRCDFCSFTKKNINVFTYKVLAGKSIDLLSLTHLFPKRMVMAEEPPPLPIFYVPPCLFSFPLSTPLFLYVILYLILPILLRLSISLTYTCFFSNSSLFILSILPNHLKIFIFTHSTIPNSIPFAPIPIFHSSHTCLSQPFLISPFISPCLHTNVPKYFNSITSSILSPPKTILHLPTTATHPITHTKVNHLYFFPSHCKIRLLFTYITHLNLKSITISNSHSDITHPCLTPTPIK